MVDKKNQKEVQVLLLVIAKGTNGTVTVCSHMYNTLLQHTRCRCTVLPTKSDSDVMFVYKVIRDLESIDHLCINPQELVTNP